MLIFFLGPPVWGRSSGCMGRQTWGWKVAEGGHRCNEWGCEESWCWGLKRFTLDDGCGGGCEGAGWKYFQPNTEQQLSHVNAQLETIRLCFVVVKVKGPQRCTFTLCWMLRGCGWCMLFPALLASLANCCAFFLTPQIQNNNVKQNKHFCLIPDTSHHAAGADRSGRSLHMARFTQRGIITYFCVGSCRYKYAEHSSQRQDKRRAL